ncbi:Spy/CpxP family protein refolding chaperone [Onishia taeanensis]|uniref:Spy/CpxP family protein refolding chaperone n=1 Tax=Onishia taeanensis TaxID=284577 RepID=A0A328XMQ8_9GAMM|nr:periplasmic heavy metal sensor [Halomonas taeanensis]RAR60248.1 Spy/CpxP family protein refolding chaperone [Halomonas taeanensis]
MTKYKQVIAIVLAAGLGIAASGGASAHGMHQGNQGAGSMMMGGGQGSMGPGMMMGGGQGSMGPGMMMGYGPGGMGPGMMMGSQGSMMPCPMMGGMGSMGGMAGMLDDEQLSTLREMRKAHRSAHFERMGEMMNLRDEMMLLMQADRPDPEEVKTLHGQMAELQGEMMADEVRMRNQKRDLLTDEQIKRMQQGKVAQ